MAVFGDLTPEEIDQLLRRERIGRLGTTGDGKVYITPVAYAYDGVYAYFLSHEGLKVQLMRRHPEVSLEVDEIRSPADWRSVLLHGVYEEVSGASERQRIIDLLVGEGEPALPGSVARYLARREHIVVYRMRIHERTGRYERSGPSLPEP